MVKKSIVSILLFIINLAVYSEFAFNILSRVFNRIAKLLVDKEVYGPANEVYKEALQGQKKILKEKAPNAFVIWNQLLEVNQKAYTGFPVDSCSVENHPIGTVFKYYLIKYLKGRVLDIGCGPQPVPLYLSDYPIENIYGIDPISDVGDHPFCFKKGFAEFLPWQDEQFHTVIIGTSLDHVLLLDDVLKEVKRVLVPGGSLVVWTSFIENAKPYDPYAQDIQAVDKYHLFHFNKDFFEESMGKFFIPAGKKCATGGNWFYNFKKAGK